MQLSLKSNILLLLLSFLFVLTNCDSSNDYNPNILKPKAKKDYGEILFAIEEERIKRDFSDSSAQDFQTETLVPAIKEIRQNSSLEDGALAIAINEGPLWRMVMSLRDSDPDLNDLCEYVTEDWTWEGDSRKQEGLEVIRMDRRNILLGEIPDKLYSRFVEIESEFGVDIFENGVISTVGEIFKQLKKIICL